MHHGDAAYGGKQPFGQAAEPTRVHLNHAALTPELGAHNAIEALWGLGTAVHSHRELPRDSAPSPRPGGRARLAVLALTAATLTSAASGALLAQGLSENQVRCMQLQQDLIAAQRGGGGGDRSELPRIDQQIAQADRVFQG